MTRALALDWAASGVRVNCIAPGYFETDLTAGMIANETLSARLLAQTPMGRFGRDPDIVGAAVFLASPASAYVTGQSLVSTAATWPPEATQAWQSALRETWNGASQGGNQKMARVALVTGGTRGIGEAISTALKEAGRTVVASYAGNDKAAEAFHGQTGIPVIKFDAGSFEACEQAVKQIESEHGPIEILVNNAGITRDATIARQTRQMWDE